MSATHIRTTVACVALLTVHTVTLTGHAQPAGRSAWARKPGAPLFTAFYSGEPPSFELLGLLPFEVRVVYEARLAQRRAYKPRLNKPADDLSLDLNAAHKQHLEGLIVALVNRPGIEVEAAAYARNARDWSERERYSEGPLNEANFAERYLVRRPQTALAPFLDILLLHRYRCAFEAAQYEAKPSVQATAAERYRTVWNRASQLTDPVLRAVVEDIDASPYVYIETSEHPRTFKR